MWNNEHEEDFRCRICLSQDVEQLISLYCICDSQLIKIYEMINEFAGMTMKEKDGFPQYICDECLAELDAGFTFRKRCRNSNMLLRKQARQHSNPLNGMSVVKALSSRPVPMIPESSVPCNGGMASRVMLVENGNGIEQDISMQNLSTNALNSKRKPDETSTSLSPYPSKSIKKMFTYSLSEVETFECMNCAKQYNRSCLKPSCERCKLSFDNYELIEAVNGAEKLQVYFCKLCNFFTFTYVTLSEHLKTHLKSKEPSAVMLKTRQTPTKRQGKADRPESFDTVINSIMGEECDKEPMKKRSKRKRTNNVDIQAAASFDVLVEVDSDNENHESENGNSEVTVSKVIVKTELPDIDRQCFDIMKNTVNYAVVFLTGVLCCECSSPFRSLKEVQLHCLNKHSNQRGGGRKNMRCHLCMKQFKNQRDFNEHQLLASKKVFYYCKFCPSLLLSNDDFYSHLQSDHPKTRITWFEKGSSSKNMLVSQISPKNMTVIPRDPIVLKANNENVFDIVKETNNYKILRLKGELCCGCRRLYSSPAELAMHCKERHPDKFGSSHGRCGYCRIAYKTEAALFRHCLQRAKKLYYCCKLCRNLLLENEDDFVAHRYARHGKLQVPENAPPAGNMLLELDNTPLP